MAEEEAVLFANEAFYRAFAERDLDAMDAIWARDAPVSCIHPGWAALMGRHQVLESWRSILGSPESPGIHCREPKVFLFGDLALVICYEAIRGSFLVASNVFVKQESGWSLIHHQAGSTAYEPVDGVSGAPERLH